MYSLTVKLFTSAKWNQKYYIDKSLDYFKPQYNYINSCRDIEFQYGVLLVSKCLDDCVSGIVSVMVYTVLNATSNLLKP